MYYVYKFFKVDTDEIIYVGKGTGRRMRDAGRSGEYASRSYSDGYNQGYHDARYRGGHTW